MFGGKEHSMLSNIEAGYKVDEPVYLLVLTKENEWVVERNIKIRESKKQKGMGIYTQFMPFILCNF